MVVAYTRATVAGLALAAALSTPPLAARDRPAPPPPCPLATTLRVADAMTLAGIQSLSQCGTVIVAPATPAETVAPPSVRIVPPRTEGGAPATMRHAAAPAIAAGSRPGGARAGGGDAVAISSHADEPQRMLQPATAVAAVLPRGTERTGSVVRVSSGSMAGAEAILAMRPHSYATRYDAVISRVAQRHRVDPLLLHAIIDQESRYRADAVSPVGARGLMQLMPGTARMLRVPGAAVTAAEANVDGGARLIRQLHGRFNDFRLTLAAYNAGEGAVRRYGNRIPPYRETQLYVQGVLARYQRLLAEQGGMR